MKTRTFLLFAGVLMSSMLGSFSQSTVQFSANSYTVPENAGVATLTAQRTGDTNTAVSVDYATVDGTATNGIQYTATNGTLVFAAGQTNQAVEVPILNNALVEMTKYFRVALSNPINAVLGTRTNPSVYISDNDVGLQFEFGGSFGSYCVDEGERYILMGVVRGDDGNFPVSVDFATSDETATNGMDYVATNGTLSFALGEKITLFTVPILNDGVKEGTETFRVTLSSPTNQVLGPLKIATVTIADNDPGAQFTRSEHWVHEDEGCLLLTVSRGNDGLMGAFTVNFATSDMTATNGLDYAATNGTLSFATGEMTKSFAVPVLDEGIAEPDEQFKVHLSNPTGGLALGTATNATVTVCDLTEMVPHRFDNIHVSPEGLVTLTLGGGYTPGVGVKNRFKPDFDIYPVELSTNLVDWTALTWVVRTNAATNVVTLVDSSASGSARRYYRTPVRAFVAPQRAPTGPHAVGFTDRTVTDDTRRNRYRISTNNSFPITIWYPAERMPGQWPGIYEREPIARDVRYGAWTGYVDRAPYWCGYSMSNAPSVSGVDRWPVVLWSHGHEDFRNDGLEWAEHLASHGYIVVGVDHADGSLVVYPDGTYLYRDPSDNVGRDLSVQLVQDRVRDFVVVLDALAQWNENDHLFAGKVDVTNVAAAGWSLGGATAGEFCRVDARCRAAVALDPAGTQEPLKSLGLQKPSISMLNPSGTGESLFSKATTNAYWFRINYTEHASFSTWYWSVTSTSLPNRRETARTVTDWTLWFLNRHVKGSAAPMPQTADYPQIRDFRQK